MTMKAAMWEKKMFSVNVPYKKTIPPFQFLYMSKVPCWKYGNDAGNSWNASQR